MYIIQGAANADLVRSRHCVLELDRFRLLPGGEEDTAYCVIETIPVEELADNDHWVKLHHDMLQDYRERRWIVCADRLAKLRGHWQGTVDSFYDAIDHRIRSYGGIIPENWDWVIEKTA